MADWGMVDWGIGMAVAIGTAIAIATGTAGPAICGTDIIRSVSIEARWGRLSGLIGG